MKIRSSNRVFSFLNTPLFALNHRNFEILMAQPHFQCLLFFYNIIECIGQWIHLD